MSQKSAGEFRSEIASPLKKGDAVFFNRDLSALEFNARVLSEGLNPGNPLLERLKFCCIVASNLDEFFMVRIASLKRQAKTASYTPCPSGLSITEQIKRCGKRVREIVDAKYDTLTNEIFPGLAEQGLVLRTPDSYSAMQAQFLRSRFLSDIFPTLTPLRIGGETGLPFSGNLTLFAAFRLHNEGEERSPYERDDEDSIAVVQIPHGLDRIIYLPDSSDKTEFALLEHVVLEYARELFPGYDVADKCLFRVTRDADLGVDEERDEDFVQAMEQIVEARRTSPPVRLTLGPGGDKLADALRRKLDLDHGDVYFKPDPLDVGSLMELVGTPGFDHLRDERWPPVDSPSVPKDEPIWETVKSGDVLLHHPYESFAPVVGMVKDASEDPGVLAIKMTLYRTSGDSPIIKALETAAKNGKQVTVLVELKARFDEEQNIGWATRLEDAGVIVVYGIARLKVHSKALLIVRREEQGIRRYLHLGTGNYNDKTAKLYTDYGLITAREDLTYEAGLFFNAITGYSAIPALKKLVMAPSALKSRLLQLIERETMKSSTDSPGHIRAKMNSLSHPDVIEALYKASQAGVMVELNVRGICMLIPGVPGLSENITVISIVGRHLEHARVFYFGNGGTDEMYAASADWMPRNLERRVELMFPVEDSRLKKRLIKALDTYFADTTHAHRLESDGAYTRVRPASRDKAFSSQRAFYEKAKERAETDTMESRKVFNVRRKPPGEAG